MRTLLLLGLAAAVLAGCSGGPSGTPSPSGPGITPAAASNGTQVPTCAPEPEDVLPWFDERRPLGSCTYFTRAELIPVRVLFTVPDGADGWVAWLGTFKSEPERPWSYVAVTVVNVANVNTDACLNKLPRDPPVGPTVDDLATALTELPPFEVTAPPQDVSRWGYSGTYLELTVPDLATEVMVGEVRFTDCDPDERLRSWTRPSSDYGFYGYTGPGQREELWILDVEGYRLVISVIRPPDSPAADVAELEAILDSLVIEVES